MSSISKHFQNSESLTILIHGQEARKEDWINRGGFTKGGDLVHLLEEKECSWMACDLYGHGEWIAEESGFNTEDISDEEWPDFLERSTGEFCRVLEQELEGRHYRSLNLVTYSMGCLVAVQMIRKGLPLEIRCIVMAVPSTEREYDDKYSLHNNLEVFSAPTVSIAMGTRDDDSSPDDIKWFFDRIPGNRKHLFSYESGHSLPVEWTIEAAGMILK